MKSVCPEPDESCTIPGTRPRADALSARTGRPPRSVTKSSWRCSASAGSRAILRSRSASFPRPSRSSRRRRRSTGEAESFRSEPSSSTARPISSATESSETLDAGGELLQRGQVVARRERAASGCTGPDRPLDQRQAPRVERAAASRPLGCVGHVGDATQIGLGRVVEQRDRLGRLLLAQAHHVRVGRRPEALGEQRSGLARRCRGEPGQHGRQLQQFEVVLAHEASVRRVRALHGHPARHTICAVRYRESLPQLNGNVLLTDGGMETTLIFLDGLDLPCFASFPLLERDDGRAAMDALLRAVPRGRAPPRGRLRARGEHLARESLVGRAARLLARRSRRGQPAGGPVRGQDPRARGGPGPADRAQRADRPRGRRLRPREPHDRRGGGGVSLVAGSASSRKRPPTSRPRSRSRTSRRRSASSGPRRSTVSPSRCPSPSRPTGGSRPVSPSPRRSSRSMRRRMPRRRTSWSTAPTRPTSCPCSTGRGRGTACSASGRTRRRRATPSSTSPTSSTTAIRSGSPRSTSRSASGSRT